MTSRSTLRVLFVFAFLPGILHGDDDTIKGRFQAAYLRCTQPPEVKCVAFSERGRQRCEACREWGGVYTYNLDTPGADELVAYASYGDTAKHFISDVLTDVYRLSEIEAAKYTPPSLPALYEDPSKYGWVEVATPWPGSLVIDNDVALLALQHLPPMQGRGPITPRRVIERPSRLWQLFAGAPATEGPLKLEEVPMLFNDVRPLAIVPDFEIEHVTPDGASKVPIGWNAWFEDPPSPKHRAVSWLRPNSIYNLVLHVAPGGYRGQHSRAARDLLSDRINASANQTSAKKLRLTALLLTDDETMRPVGPGTAELFVDLEKIRDWNGVGPNGDALGEQRSRRDTAYVFGEAFLTVRTTEREGTAWIGMSIWDEQSWPIDELPIPVCVATSAERARVVCEDTTKDTVGFSSFDIGTPSNASPPDAAIHFISVGDSVTGIFRKNQRGAPFVAWKIPGGLKKFTSHIQALSEVFARAKYDEARLARAGDELYRLLFGQLGSGRDPAAYRAQAAFEAFASPHVGRTSTRLPPSLFVRFLVTTPERGLRSIPLAFANVGSTRDGFLGYHFRIHSPLPRRGVERSECVANWKMVLPSQDHAELGHLRRKFDEELASWAQAVRPLETMRAFGEWVRNGEDVEPAALMVLSHHASDFGVGSLSFDDHDDVRAAEIERRFAPGSIAILNGCGTAGVASDDIVQRLNWQGVGTVIASSHSVDSDMAVAYLGCLAEQLTTKTVDAPMLSVAHFRALECLRRARPSEGRPSYGAGSLAYTFLGDPTVRLCSPQKDSSTRGVSPRDTRD